MESAKIFNKWKELIEDFEITNELDCLRSIEINISNICNLKCPFCPHSLTSFQQEKTMMSLDTAKLLAEQLKSFNYKGFICLAGFGEPTLNPQVKEIIKALKDFKVVLVTNGIPLSKEDFEELDKYCQLKISVHHWDCLPLFKEKFKNTKAIFRNHDMINPEMNKYNRNGIFEKLNNYKGLCYYTYYEVMIDYDGCYLQCNADWNRKSKTKASLYNTHIKDWFVNNQMKTTMLQGREHCKHCCCDIDGKLIGENCYQYFKKINNIS